ncbi:MAG: proton extrusion protein PcxA [Leptolyngbyaceae bacterium]|nr:proton extrusion protein PcxA [Leptolyngbyaceae bacterium]
MKSAGSRFFQSLFKASNRWFLRTPERALEEAYEAALAIKAIEDTHFDGGLISPEFGNYSQNGHAYFQAELKKYLNIIKLRMSEFKTSSSIFRLVNVAEGNATPSVQFEETTDDTDDEPTDIQTLELIDKPREILLKLKFIDEVLVRYESLMGRGKSSAKASGRQGDRPRQRGGAIAYSRTDGDPSRFDQGDEATSKYLSPNNPNAPTQKNTRNPDAASFADKTGVLPRSILRTVDRIKRELDPKAEDDIVAAFRSSKDRTFISLRFILLLIIIPLLTHQISKNFIVGPIVDSIRGEEVQVFLNEEMEEDALRELQQYNERLRFEVLIGKEAELTEEEITEKVREEASVIEAKYRRRSSDAIKNVFSDILSVIAFSLVLVGSRREISALKSFIDELVYGLSDSAKAFIIILFTDTFVGFHSPHGWEVLLEGISRHFGLPANRDFIFLFIATFPVILDTVFKYWIFRYLNRISPSAVATYKNMNE